jgi:uncharacterized protein YjiS (DUF1127 family)
MSSLNLATDLLSSTGRDADAGRWFARGWAAVNAWRARLRERNALAGLDERMLKDIGLSRADAIYETSKYFWQS